MEEKKPVCMGNIEFEHQELLKLLGFSGNFLTIRILLQAKRLIVSLNYFSTVSKFLNETLMEETEPVVTENCKFGCQEKNQ